MNLLRVTDDGRCSVDDFRSIYKAVLIELSRGAMKVFELVNAVRARYHEFKYLKVNVVIQAIDELIKQKLVVSTYVPVEEW